MGSVYVSCDLAQMQDYTAVTVMEIVADYEPLTTPGAIESRFSREVRVPIRVITHIDRWQGMTYPKTLDRIVDILNTPRIRYEHDELGNELPFSNDVELILDATGVGQPVVEMAREMGLDPVAIVITGGHASRYDKAKGSFMVPRIELLNSLVVDLQREQIKFADDLELADVLIRELMNLRVKENKQTGVESYEGWRDSENDDIALSLAMASWRASFEHTRQAVYADRIAEENGVTRSAPLWDPLEFSGKAGYKPYGD